MSTEQKLSLYYRIISLDDKEFDVVYKMMQGLTADNGMEIERLSPEEAAYYEEGFEEMRRGEYVTLEQILADREED
jgi:hypothetical protein